MLKDAVEIKGKLSIGILFHVLDEFLLGLPECYVVMATDVPSQVRISPSTLVIGIGLQDLQKFFHHYRLANLGSTDSPALIEVIQPDFDLPPFVDADLIFIDAEGPNG